MFSATTTELSTSRPTEIISASSDRMLSDSSAKNMAVSAMSRLKGMARVMMRVIRSRRRKKYSTKTAKSPPILPLSSRVSRLSVITRPWSKSGTMKIRCSAGLSCIARSSPRMARATSRVLASPSLSTTSATAGRELARIRNRASGGL